MFGYFFLVFVSLTLALDISHLCLLSSFFFFFPSLPFAIYSKTPFIGKFLVFLVKETNINIIRIGFVKIALMNQDHKLAWVLATNPPLFRIEIKS
jgi:hypothetical protein